MIRIGLSACFFHADPQRAVFKGKTLIYLEESLAHWVESEGVLVYMIPSLAKNSPVSFKDMVADLHGLVLSGGSDVAPGSYGETPLKPEWKGDPIRDEYEIALVREFMCQKKPVLGICRGAQLLNVALGGSLYQDITMQVSGSLVHRNWDIYDQNMHEIAVEKGSLLEKVCGVPGPGQRINSVHHQSIKALAKDLVIEARSPKDGVIEAVRYSGEPFVYALQWHPEFHAQGDTSLYDARPLLKLFIKHAGAKGS